MLWEVVTCPHIPTHCFKYHARQKTFLYIVIHHFCKHIKYPLDLAFSFFNLTVYRNSLPNSNRERNFRRRRFFFKNCKNCHRNSISHNCIRCTAQQCELCKNVPFQSVFFLVVSLVLVTQQDAIHYNSIHQLMQFPQVKHSQRKYLFN